MFYIMPLYVTDYLFFINFLIATKKLFSDKSKLFSHFT